MPVHGMYVWSALLAVSIAALVLAIRVGLTGRCEGKV